MLKINSETDFAAKSDTFLDFVDYLGGIVLDQNDPNLDLENFLKKDVGSKSIKEIVDEMIAKIGENILISDLRVFDKKNSNLSFYVHNAYRKNIGKIISILKYSTENNDDKTISFAKNLCMHIAALKPRIYRSK